MEIVTGATATPSINRDLGLVTSTMPVPLSVMGMKTVLITGKRSDATNESEATKPGDAPVVDDPAVDVAMETIEEMRRTLPGLWQTPAVFPSRHCSWNETC